ncbi:MAG: hypothetical protein COV44_04315 [Deltaproteobacteria bacterium CG11_big_fil_rev_8_21_14_0_20_45_16]|nr:MAG: hypothetical protein COV44_04315 [Deltaproteobacteria bacterium CG11_big_fil_rev_8_21_14_0_20_45_16]
MSIRHFFLAALYLLDSRGISEVWINVSGLSFTGGRILHFMALSQKRQKFRVAGMLTTFSCYILAAALLVYLFYIERYKHLIERLLGTG